MSKRPRFTLVTLLAVALAIAGCGGGATPTADSGDTVQPGAVDTSAGPSDDSGESLPGTSEATKVEVPVTGVDDASGQAETVSTEESVSAEESVSLDQALVPLDQAPEPLDQAEVLAAALVIASGGDIEQALLDGSFTVAEVQAAVEALETGTLGHLVG